MQYWKITIESIYSVFSPLLYSQLSNRWKAAEEAREIFNYSQ